jgi:hypothetical protein
MRDCCSLMVQATRARGVTPEGGVRFSDEIISTGSAFSPDQVLCFGSLDYIANHNDELCLCDEAPLEDSKPLAMFPLVGLLRANLEVLS